MELQLDSQSITGQTKHGTPEIVLLATDGSENSDLAADQAVSITRETGAELHVIHVWHNVPTAHFRGLVRAELERRGQDVLDRQAEEIEEAGGTIVGTYLREGHAADEIVELSDEIGAGLIVVGSRSLGLVGRVISGSVSAEIVRHASSPVLIVSAKGRSQRSYRGQTAVKRSA